MAGWSSLRDGYGVNCDVNYQGNFKFEDGSMNEKPMEEGNGDDDGTLRGLFDQVLTVLLRGLYAKNAIRPIPALLGDGQSIDLFRLFYLVRERGGFSLVSKEKLWGWIAESLGIDFMFSASLELIYFKYLDELDQWLNRISKDGNSANKSSECGGTLQLLWAELEKRFRGSAVDGVKPVKIGNELMPTECDKVCDRIDMTLGENVQIPAFKRKRENKLLDDANVATCDDDEQVRDCKGDRSVGWSDQGSFETDTNDCKRKRDSWEEMLSWLKRVAKNPFDFSKRRIPRSFRWIEDDGKESWSLVLLVRELTLKRKYPNSKEDGCSSHQKKQKIHPSIYDDPASSHLEGVRFSKRVPSMVRSPKCSCCNASSTKESRLANHSKAAKLEKDPEEDKKEKTLDPPAPQPSEPTDEPSPHELLVQKHVNVGPQFQAEIPPWTGGVSEGDSNYVGTRVWPPENWKQNTLLDTRLVLGKGRRDFCDCPCPGSVECVRFHTAENKMKLKHELGRAFYQWKFDRMGEVVSLAWTPQEEEKFKTVMSATPLSMGKSYFRRKTRKELIDYYFNVFLQGKRSYQNRVTPNAIDSDDELSEFGSVGGLYGHAASIAAGSNPGICTKNEQCLDFDVSVKVKKAKHISS